MAFSKSGILSTSANIQPIAVPRQSAARSGSWSGRRTARAAVSAAVALSLGGCSTIDSWFGSDAKGDTTAKIPTRYLGSVVADEPSAVGVGDDILRQKGNAADAAAAMALMLTVTLPSRAGLMGGGVCLVRDTESANIESLEFLPRSVPGSMPGSAVEVPGMVRGVAALQARYGQMDWRQVVVGIERMANNGVPVAAQLTADAAIAGVSLPPGTQHAEPALGAVFTSIRLNGPSDFYTGDVGRQLVAAGVSDQALASYAPTWRPAIQIASDHNNLYFAPTPGGRVAAGAFAALVAADEKANDAAARFQIARAAATAALAKAMPGAAVPADQPTGSTGFVVTDASGLTVSCALSMGNLFGTKQKLATPALYAASPIAGNAAAQMGVVPAIAYNPNNSALLGGYVGSAGTSAPADVAAIAFATIHDSRGAVTTVGAMRRPDDTGATAVPDRVAVVHCPNGLVRDPESCAVAKDPRGFGFAQTTDLVK
jgi:gamma-glutamyltranspeptidase / glutathione hydrolase